MTTGDAQHRWWLCCWGHAFEHDPVPDGEELTCPASGDEGPCRTSFVFMPYPSRAEAEQALRSGTSTWAPWAR